MIVRKAFKYRLKVNKSQGQILNQWMGANRFLWNKILAHNLDRLKHKHKMMWYYESCFWIPIWKSSEEYSFLKEPPAQTLLYTAMALDRAFKDAFDKKQPLKRIPKFKSKDTIQSNLKFTFTNLKHIDPLNSLIKVPKLGWVKYINSREIVGNPKNATISRIGEHYYISVQTEQEIEVPIHPSTSEIGIDLGITNFATLSDGTFIEGTKSFKRYADKLAVQQRKLKNKTKFSRNWVKQQKKIAKIHSKISNMRNDFLHKTSTELCRNNSLIVMEDLKVSNMSRSAKGTIESPGRNVRQKSGLNRSILDQGWGEFRRQITYKQLWIGGDVVFVPPQYTSQTCVICGNCCRENRVSQSEFICTKCNYTCHADQNAAVNILKRSKRD